MAVTPLSVRNTLLLDVGLEDSTLAPSFYLTRILDDLNAELQVIFASLPEWWSKETIGVSITAPTSRAAMVMTNGSRTFSGGSIHDWMFGNTIVVSGDTRQNEIIDATTLRHPYLGTSGTQTAIVYFDAVKAPGGYNVMRILPPVKMLGDHPDLVPMSGRAAIFAHGAVQSAYGDSKAREIARPDGYIVEKFLHAGYGSIRPMLRLNKLPDAQYGVVFEAMVGPEAITDLTSTTAIPMPAGYGESILLPKVRYRFSSFKHWQGDAKRVQAEAEKADLVLGSLKDPKGHVDNRVNMGGGNW